MVSFGVVDNLKVIDYDWLLFNVDNVLYSVKNSGCNRVFMYNKGCMILS